MLRKVATGVAGTSAVGAAAFYAADPTAAGRTYVLWTEMAPVVVRYRALEQKQKLRAAWTGHRDAALEDREWEALHAVHAKPTVEVMRRMLGSYVKLGQFLALRPDVCPEAWTKELRTLETAVPAQATELVRATIREAYGVERVEDVFATFDDTPVGSASIGQVHRATLKDGRAVAVKVQYGAANEEVMRSDIRNGKLAFRLLAPEQVAVLDEVEAQFATEFDYRREAQNLGEIRANLAKAGLLRRGSVAVPEPLPELCTKEVLVMEFLAGENLVDGIRELGERAARRRGVTFDELVAETRASFDRDGYPAPYEGPGPRAMEAYRRLDVARCAIVNALAKAGLAAPREPMLGGLNPARVMKTLCAVHGHELLVDGVFNGDPHAGNFLLMPDGTVGCIDYGQVKRLTTQERHWLCRCYIALARGDDAKLRELADLVGMKSRYMLDITRQKMLTFALDRDGRDVTDGLNFQQFLDKMYAQDPWDEVVPMIIMPSRLCIFLRGIGLMMHHPISCTREFLPIAERVLRDEGVDY